MSYERKPPPPKRLVTILRPGKDEALGHLGGAEIDFGTQENAENTGKGSSEDCGKGKKTRFSV